jgi:hypothetical protein
MNSGRQEERHMASRAQGTQVQGDGVEVTPKQEETGGARRTIGQMRSEPIG